jgi:hypothetical protein
MVNKPGLGYAVIQPIEDELARLGITYKDVASATYSRTTDRVMVTTSPQSGDKNSARLIEFDRNLTLKSDREVKTRFEKGPKVDRFYG